MSANWLDDLRDISLHYSLDVLHKRVKCTDYTLGSDFIRTGRGSATGRIDLSSCSSFVGSFKEDMGIHLSSDTMLTH